MATVAWRKHGEGGEARPAADMPAVVGAWYAIWTKSHCERLVADQLSAKGIDPFLPEVPAPSRVRKSPPVSMPLFPGYLFVREAMDKTRYLEILKARGVVRILDNGWTNLTPIPDAEIEAVQRLLAAGEHVALHPYLQHGDRVRVIDGPLFGVEGLYVGEKQQQGRLLVSIDLLGRSVSVEMGRDAVSPVRQGRDS